MENDQLDDSRGGPGVYWRVLCGEIFAGLRAELIFEVNSWPETLCTARLRSLNTFACFETSAPAG
jgi:hypothetical protein